MEVSFRIYAFGEGLMAVAYRPTDRPHHVLRGISVSGVVLLLIRIKLFELALDFGFYWL